MPKLVGSNPNLISKHPILQPRVCPSYGFGTTAAEEEAWIYVMRKGDKIRNTKGKKAVYRIPIDIEGGLFSKKVGAFHEGTKVGTATDPGALTSAWVKMSYAFPVAYKEYAAPYKYKKLLQDHTYGFMGFSNAMTKNDLVTSVSLILLLPPRTKSTMYSPKQHRMDHRHWFRYRSDHHHEAPGRLVPSHA